MVVLVVGMLFVVVVVVGMRVLVAGVTLTPRTIPHSVTL
jgi:hypothetical protein